DADHNLSAKASDGITLDSTAPSSKVASLAASSPLGFSVSWSGSDAISGVKSFDVQVRDDGVTAPGGPGSPGTWTNWKTNTSLTSATFADGVLTHRYCFRSRATDKVGNVEDWPAQPDTCTRVGDTIKPTGASVSINAGATFAAGHSVTLSLA